LSAKIRNEVASTAGKALEVTSEFKEKVLGRVDDYSTHCNIIYLPKTDHSIMFQKSRDYLFQQTVNCLDRI